MNRISDLIAGRPYALRNGSPLDSAEKFKIADGMVRGTVPIVDIDPIGRMFGTHQLKLPTSQRVDPAKVLSAYSGIDLCRPPFRALWLEFGAEDQRGEISTAMLVREEAEETEYEGVVVRPFTVDVFSDASGQVRWFARGRFFIDLTSSLAKHDPRATHTDLPLAGQFWGAPGVPAHYTTIFYAIACYALSLMNCQGVEMRDYRRTNEDIGAKQRAKRKLAYVTVKELVLKRQRSKISFREHVATLLAGGMPLHMVRGHIRHYERGAGMFGKPWLRKPVYVPAFLRGDIENGARLHDYRVEAPDPTPSDGEADAA